MEAWVTIRKFCFQSRLIYAITDNLLSFQSRPSFPRFLDKPRNQTQPRITLEKQKHETKQTHGQDQVFGRTTPVMRQERSVFTNNYREGGPWFQIRWRWHQGDGISVKEGKDTLLFQAAFLRKKPGEDRLLFCNSSGGFFFLSFLSFLLLSLILKLLQMIFTFIPSLAVKSRRWVLLLIRHSSSSSFLRSFRLSLCFRVSC
jgi:hypothetical protein